MCTSKGHVRFKPNVRFGPIADIISTGSETAEKTIGIVVVAPFAANADGGPPAAKSSVTGKLTSSEAKAGNLSRTPRVIGC